MSRYVEWPHWAMTLIAKTKRNMENTLFIGLSRQLAAKREFASDTALHLIDRVNEAIGKLIGRQAMALPATISATCSDKNSSSLLPTREYK